MNTLLLGDLATCLQLAGVWLDPLTMDDRIDSEEDDILSVLREYRPEQYASYLWYAYEGYSETQIDFKVTGELNEWLPYDGEFMELLQAAAGLPITFYGAGIYDEDFEGYRSGIIEMTQLFLMHDDSDPKDYAYAAHLLMRGVYDGKGGELDVSDDLSCALAWLFSSTGNTLLDMSFNEGSENGLSFGDWERLEFITEMHHEAEDIHARAMDAFILLEEDDDLYGQFCGDLIRAYWQAIEEVHCVYDAASADRAPYFRAPLGERGDHREADPEPHVDDLRDRAA